MTFKKGDPRINRNGRPRDLKKKELEEALRSEGDRLGTTPFKKIAQEFYQDKQVMIAVLKKYVPDMTKNEIEGMIQVNKLPVVRVNGEPLVTDIGE